MSSRNGFEAKVVNLIGDRTVKVERTVRRRVVGCIYRRRRVRYMVHSTSVKPAINQVVHVVPIARVSRRKSHLVTHVVV